MTRGRPLVEKPVNSDFLVLLDHCFQILGDYGFPFGLPLHVASGSSACDPRLLDAFGVVADECSIDDVLAGSSAEFAGVVFKVQGHSSLNRVKSIKEEDRGQAPGFPTSHVERELLAGGREYHVVVPFEVREERLTGLGVHDDDVVRVALPDEVDDLTMVGVRGEVVLLELA